VGCVATRGLSRSRGPSSPSHGHRHRRCLRGPDRSFGFRQGEQTNARHRGLPQKDTSRAELGVERRSETSRCAEPHNPADRGSSGAILERGIEIVELKIDIVIEDLVVRHPRRKEIKDELDRVTQAAHDRLAMTDAWIRNDSIEPRHGGSLSVDRSVQSLRFSSTKADRGRSVANSIAVEVRVTTVRCQTGAPGGTRTHTVRGLNPLPLPIGPLGRDGGTHYRPVARSAHQIRLA
jgi:hypothetical protein